MKLTKDLVVLDLETTGTWVDKDRIIEIALIKMKPDGTREDMVMKINPGMPIPPVVTELTGISNGDVQNAPQFKTVAQEIQAFIGDADLGGFNIDRFDLPLLKREFNEAGVEFSVANRNVYDAQKVYHINEKRDLSAAYQFFCQKELVNAHSAMADTEATLEILAQQMVKYGDESPESLLQYTYQTSNEFYDKERKFRWWNGKLYMMFGKYARRHSLDEVVKKDRGYLEWILSANFSQDIKLLVENALNGQMPVYGQKIDS